MNSLYRQWFETLQSAGIKPLSDDTCCRLLAVLYVFGGERSEFTLHDKLTTDLRYAQRRLHLLGGETPDATLLPVLQRYISELAPQGLAVEPIKTPWAVELMKRYKIKL